jgi:hypothetical protein
MSYLKQYISGRGYSIAMETAEPAAGIMADSLPPEVTPKPVSYVIWKYHTDPEFKEKFKQTCAKYIKKRFEEDPDYKAKVREKDKNQKKERYHTDPEYRELVLQRNREYHRKRREARDALKTT